MIIVTSEYVAGYRVKETKGQAFGVVGAQPRSRREHHGRTALTGGR